ncbi:MAG: alpha/beta hydrolase [Oscillospiraceae bacterium]
MKKIIGILLALTLTAATFSGCSNAPKETITDALAQEKAAAHVQMILDGKFEELTQDFSSKVKAQVSSAQLREAWEKTAGTDTKEYQGTKVEKVTTNPDKSITVATDVEQKDKTLKVSLTYQGDGKISGIWFNAVPKIGDIEDNDRYTQQPIEVGEYKLTGILTLPKNVKNPPVVVMLQGSGPSDFDETISANKPFKDIANALAEKGIATLRYNKRFFQHSELGATQATVEEEYLEDVSAAIALAKEKVGENIYVLGHSLGGMSVARIAKDNKDVVGIISLAGTPRGLEELIYDQNKASVDLMDTTKQQKDELMKTVEKEVAKVKALTKDDGSAPFGFPAKYWLSLKGLDTLNLSKQLTIPMLMLQGSADFQVYKDKDFDYWKSELAGKDNATFKLYDNLNHLFMQSKYKGKMDVTEYDVPGTVEKQVTDDIAQWIADNEK